MEQKNVCVVGAGNMGTALLRGMLKSDWSDPDRLMATHPRSEHRETLADDLGLRVEESNVEGVKWADVVVLCVKPQILHRVLTEVAPAVTPDKAVISIAAGVPTRTIESLLPDDVPVVRAMPNVPATVELGATAVCRGTHADDEHYETARHVFEAVGIVEEVDEGLMDAVTGLSGTGPMYIFQIIEGLSDAGVKVGLSRHVATRLVIQTVLGSAKMAETLDVHPGQLKDMVTSPGGTAIAALHTMEQGGFRARLMDAVEAATDRSAELGAQLERRLGEEAAGGRDGGDGG